MREAKGHSLVHFFREGEERAGEEVELLEKGTIFPGFAAEEISVNKEGRDWLFLLLARIPRRSTARVFSAVRTAAFIGSKIEEYGLYGLLYGLLYGAFISARFSRCVSCCTMH